MFSASLLRAEASDRQLLTRYALIAALISLLVVSLVALALRQERERYRERALVATQNIARQLDQQVSAVFDKVDLALQASQLYYATMLEEGEGEAGRLNHYLASQETLLPEVISFRIADRKGFVRYGNEIKPGSEINIGDRDYFIRARDKGDAELLVQGPLMARISKQWVIVVARRLTAPDGAFAGVVYANLPCHYFEKVLSLASLGPSGAATIRGTDLALVHRYPDTRNAVGSREVSRQLAEVIAAKPEVGQYIAVTKLDGVERSNAYRRLRAYPFYIIVGLATADYLGGWQQYATGVSGVALVTLLIIWLAMLWLYRTQRDLNHDVVQRVRIGQELEAAMRERLQLYDELEARKDALEEVNATLEQKVEARTAELSRANEELTRLARRDTLTGVSNRLAADEHLHEEFLRMKRTGRPYALLLIDIDHFKAVNDHHGHAQGDAVLQQVARVLNDNCRASDFVARFGGEEFLAILPDTTGDSAWLVAEKMREAVTRTTIDEVGVVTISVGVTSASRTEEDERVALRRADRNLYKAKANGRNQVADDETACVLGEAAARAQHVA